MAAYPLHHRSRPPKMARLAYTLTSSVRSSFIDLDNGPYFTLLRRELKWLMEDAVQEPENVNNNGGSVRLRVEIKELYMLWKQRVGERRPFQYVVGCEHWKDLVLCVEERVLILTLETELIIDLVGDVVLGNEGLRELKLDGINLELHWTMASMAWMIFYIVANGLFLC